MWLLISAGDETFAVEVSGDETIQGLRSLLTSEHDFDPGFVLAYAGHSFPPGDRRCFNAIPDLVDMSTLLLIKSTDFIGRPPEPRRVVPRPKRLPLEPSSEPADVLPELLVQPRRPDPPRTVTAPPPAEPSPPRTEPSPAKPPSPGPTPAVPKTVKEGRCGVA
jgi:hypothetical protein